jgi:hypothetical protein
MAEHLLDAAVRRLANGDGAGGLRDLGVHRGQALRDSGVGVGVLYENFREAGYSAVRGLADAMLDRLYEQHKARLDAVQASLLERVQALREGAGREVLTRAILDELSDRGAVADHPDPVRARERAYYLAVALVDAVGSDGSASAAAGEALERDLRFRGHLARTHMRGRETRLEAFRDLLDVTRRVPVHDLARLELTMRALLEGAVLLRRIAAAHERPGTCPTDSVGKALFLTEEATVDALLRMFIALSRPAPGADANDPDVVIFGAEGAIMAADAAVFTDRDALYERLVTEIDQLPAGQMVCHASLHVSAARPARTPQGERLKEAMRRFATVPQNHWRNLEKVDTLAELDQLIERLQESVARRDRITWRALLMDSPPALAPLIIGDRTAVLGREEDGLIVDAACFFSPSGHRWAASHFETLWRDERGYTIATPNGFNVRGIDDARRRLRSQSPLR